MKTVQLVIMTHSSFGYIDNFVSVKRALFGIANTRVATKRKTERERDKQTETREGNRQRERERDESVSDTDEEGE